MKTFLAVVGAVTLVVVGAAGIVWAVFKWHHQISAFFKGVGEKLGGLKIATAKR